MLLLNNSQKKYTRSRIYYKLRSNNYTKEAELTVKGTKNSQRVLQQHVPCSRVVERACHHSQQMSSGGVFVHSRNCPHQVERSVYLEVHVEVLENFFDLKFDNFEQKKFKKSVLKLEIERFNF